MITNSNAPAQADDAPSEATASYALSDVASSSSSFPPKPLSCPKPLAPPLPSESEATTSGAEPSRPLKSVGKRNKKRQDEAQRELQLKLACRDSSSSSSSSEGELFKDQKAEVHPFFFEPPTLTKPQEFFSQTNRGAWGNKGGGRSGEGGAGRRATRRPLRLSSRQGRESAIIAYIPPYPQTPNTHRPGCMHVVVVGRARPPPHVGNPPHD